jgi:hypothetical protein
VKVIRHEQQQATMPTKTKVVIGCGGKDGVTGSRAAQLIAPGRLAVHRDEERAACFNPLRNPMWESPAHRKVHLRVLYQSMRPIKDK